ncbi:Thioredoxin Y2, chloroplastic [Capsicum baccatum]|uniref:Thioredoxin Y2, chloroplastic n=1 Tax=Capsicum baccatum TaxID=33114 RepID=A0A2G2WZ66_CAPBA|nr:thioredoxin Y1, chloroplastic [Capsicum annuum]KAF3619611.1 Thioredoxin Y2, chloroplastic [Capsicum annuum]KAF3658951.1 Thioredoxin Y2, chloroplastic [Capsicum annuum]PHT50515.1 Thioredoxin Y2, chloroplastic [Capsicum baccatum]
MAISLAAAGAATGAGALASSSSSSSTKFSYLSSLQFPREIRRFRIGNYGLKSKKGSSRLFPLVEAKKQTFSSFEDLLENSEKPLLVDFYATWCGPCQFMVPILNEVGESMKDKIQVVKIDTEKYPVIADKYKIQALPTFILFKDGNVCDRFEGALNAPQLMQRIESALEVKQ